MLKALTRILHRSTPDELMFEVPTVLIRPLHVECDSYCWYPVEDRAQVLWMGTCSCLIVQVFLIFPFLCLGCC